MLDHSSILLSINFTCHGVSFFRFDDRIMMMWRITNRSLFIWHGADNTRFTLRHAQANGRNIEMNRDFPFMLSLSKHGN